MARPTTARSRQLKALIRAAVILAGFDNYRDFLRAARISNTTLEYQVQRGRINYELAQRIETATGGRVTAEQLCRETESEIV